MDHATSAGGELSEAPVNEATEQEAKDETFITLRCTSSANLIGLEARVDTPAHDTIFSATGASFARRDTDKSSLRESVHIAIGPIIALLSRGKAETGDPDLLDKSSAFVAVEILRLLSIGIDVDRERRGSSFALTEQDIGKTIAAHSARKESQ